MSRSRTVWSKSAGDQDWRALSLLIYPAPEGVVISLRARLGRGGSYRDRVLGTLHVDLGAAPDMSDLGACLLAASDALADAADTLV